MDYLKHYSDCKITDIRFILKITLYNLVKLHLILGYAHFFVKFLDPQ